MLKYDECCVKLNYCKLNIKKNQNHDSLSHTTLENQRSNEIQKLVDNEDFLVWKNKLFSFYILKKQSKRSTLSSKTHKVTEFVFLALIIIILVSVLIVCIPILDVLVASLTSLTLPRQKISIKTLPDLTGSATD